MARGATAIEMRVTTPQVTPRGWRVLASELPDGSNFVGCAFAPTGQALSPLGFGPRLRGSGFVVKAHAAPTAVVAALL